MQELRGLEDALMIFISDKPSNISIVVENIFNMVIFFSLFSLPDTINTLSNWR